MIANLFRLDLFDLDFFTASSILVPWTEIWHERPFSLQGFITHGQRDPLAHAWLGFGSRAAEAACGCDVGERFPSAKARCRGGDTSRTGYGDRGERAEGWSDERWEEKLMSRPHSS